MARQLMKKMVSSESTKPSEKTVIANAPMAKEETTILADSHYGIVYQRFVLPPAP